jgi:hypothetical protein
MLLVAAAASGCGGSASTLKTPTAPKIVLAVMTTESQEFPKVAAAASDALASAKVAGVDETKVKKTSLEVVKLQIECDEPTPACTAAAGKELGANRLLYAQIAAAAKKRVDVTITLFDVDASSEKKTAHDVFRDQATAIAGLPKLVTEATQP